MTQLAITGGNPVRDKPFPAWPVWDDTELEALSEVVRSGGWSIFRGTKVRALETQFAAYQGAKYGRGVHKWYGRPGGGFKSGRGWSRGRGYCAGLNLADHGQFGLIRQCNSGLCRH